MSYSDDLKHPKWQKKRLEILEWAGFACENCGDDDSTLNIHHGYYEKGLKPWEYDSETLHCLCGLCHSKMHNEKDYLLKEFGHTLEYEKITGYMLAIRSRTTDNLIIRCTSFEMVVGIADAIGTPVEYVMKNILNGIVNLSELKKED